MRACRQKWRGRLGAIPSRERPQGSSRRGHASGETVLRGIEQQMLRGCAKREFVHNSMMGETNNKILNYYMEASA